MWFRRDGKRNMERGVVGVVGVVEKRFRFGRNV